VFTTKGVREFAQLKTDVTGIWQAVPIISRPAI
jgi:hypothetical protein